MDEHVVEFTAEQQRLWNERQGLLNMAPKGDKGPQICYSVRCRQCNEEHFVRGVGKTPLTDRAIHTRLILDGWVFGPAGYECPKCQGAWSDAVVAFITRDRTVESEER